MEITPKFAIPRQKFLQYFKTYLQFFAVFKNSYVFIPVFLGTPMAFCGSLRFCRNLSEKHWSRNYSHNKTFYFHLAHIKTSLICTLIIRQYVPCLCLFLFITQILNMSMLLLFELVTVKMLKYNYK